MRHTHPGVYLIVAGLSAGCLYGSYQFLSEGELIAALVTAGAGLGLGWIIAKEILGKS